LRLTGWFWLAAFWQVFVVLLVDAPYVEDFFPPDRSLDSFLILSKKVAGTSFPHPPRALGWTISRLTFSF